MTPAPRKFVLVDQSIVELGGHHYEYALRVLQAAREDGFDAQLVTNRHLSTSLSPGFPVLPIYRFGVWDRPLRLGGLVIRSFPPPSWIRIIRRAAFAARQAVAWLASRSRIAPSAVDRQPSGPASTRELLRPFTTVLQSVGSGARFFGLNPTKILQFERDTLQMIAALDLHASDVVFLPTLSETELLGLGRAISNCVPGNGIGWHVLFRRPPAPARPPYADATDKMLAQLKKCFAAFDEATRGHRIRFYTDTELLTRQYNQLGVARFDTLPIPVPESFNQRSDRLRSIDQVPTILYAGDARVEKGFQLLPALVADLYQAPTPGGPPRFIIQSNFSVPGGEPAAAQARRELQSFADNGVRLIDRPLLPDAYCAIFQASDISLIPYDRLEYRARSSGVFAESVAAGLATVVPAGTWMAAQLDAPIAGYHRSLLAGSLRMQTYAGADLCSDSGSGLESFDVPAVSGADHLIIAVRASTSDPESLPLVLLEWLDSNRAFVHCDRAVGVRDESGQWTCMFRLRPQLRAQLTVVPHDRALSTRFRVERIDLVSAGRELPLSAAGVIYVDDIALSDAVREVLHHLAHYVRTAAVFQVRVDRAAHSPAVGTGADPAAKCAPGQRHAGWTSTLKSPRRSRGRTDRMKAPPQPPPSPDCFGRKIGILIVAYNAVTTIAQVLKRIPGDVWDNVQEVVVFDDASRDHTYELVQGLKMLSGLQKLTVIKNQANLGYGGNQKLGYRYFLDKGFDVVVLLHGDGQYAPEILAHLYAPIVSGAADAVFGSRMMKTYGGPLRGGMPLYKFVGNRILTFFENRALGMHLTEFHSGYRAYSLAALAKIDFSHMTDVFHFDTQIIIKLHHQGLRIVEVPIPTYYGTEICYVDGLKYAKDVFASVLRYKRTRASVAQYPEYAEYFQHYPMKRSRHSSYQYFLSWIGKRQQVLDIGCGEGFFAKEVVEAGNSIVGIDALESPTYVRLFDAYAQANLEQGLEDAEKMLAHRRFDRILLQDVLEHVSDPARLLRDCSQYLAPDGLLLVSVPNVANITVRLSLLFGRFQYTERGILDRTHLRFFTRRTARGAIQEAGYTIEREGATVMPIELALNLNADHPLMRLVNAMLAVGTRAFPKLLGYQLLFAVRPTASAHPAAPERARRRQETVATQ